MPDAIGETLARLITHVEALEKILPTRNAGPGLHAPDHGLWRWDDFSI